MQPLGEQYCNDVHSYMCGMHVQCLHLYLQHACGTYTCREDDRLSNQQVMNILEYMEHRARRRLADDDSFRIVHQK